MQTTDHYWKIGPHNSTTVIAWGTEDEAAEYCGLLNHIEGRLTNCYTYDLVTGDDYPDDVKPLADRCELNLADELRSRRVYLLEIDWDDINKEWRARVNGEPVDHQPSINARFGDPTIIPDLQAAIVELAAVYGVPEPARGWEAAIVTHTALCLYAAYHI